MIRGVIVLLAFVIILNSASAGIIENKTYTLSYLDSKPVDAASEYINSVRGVLDFFSFAGPVKSLATSAVLAGLGLQDINTNKQFKPTYTPKNTSLQKMTKAWERVEKAKSEPPEKGLDDLEKGLIESKDAYLEEEASLIRDAAKADWMGVDKFDYSGYSANLGKTSLDELSDEIEKLDGYQKVYTFSELNRIREYAQRLKPNTFDINIIGRIIALFSPFKIDEYYNAIFSGGGAYGKLVEIRGLLNRAMDEMLSEWESKNEEFKKGMPTRPDTSIDEYKMRLVFNLGNETAQKYLSIGEDLEKRAKAKYSKAWETYKSKKEDYLYLALVQIEEAIDYEREASTSFERSMEIEDTWKKMIDSRCRENFSTNSDESEKLYDLGKKECSSDDYNTKLDGVFRIAMAKKLESSGDSGLLQEINERLGYVQDLINRAKQDHINVSFEELELKKIKKTADPNVIRKLEVIRDEIIKKAYDKYNAIESIRDKLLKISNNYTDKYAYLFNGNKLNVEQGLGRLRYVLAYYEGELNKEAKGLEPDIQIKAKDRSWVCNEKSFVHYTATLSNPYPIYINGKINLGSSQQISLAPGETKFFNYSKEDVLVKCKFESERTNNKTEYIVSIDPKYPLDKVYLGMDGNLEENPIVKRDLYGLYVSNVQGREIVSFVIRGKASGKSNKPGGSSESSSGKSTNNDYKSHGGDKNNNNYPNNGKPNQSTGFQARGKSSEQFNNSSFNNTGNIWENSGDKRVGDKDLQLTSGVSDNLSKADLAEYMKLLNVLKKNKNCTSVDFGFLEKNKSRDKLEFMKFAVGQLEISAASKINELPEDKMDSAERYLENNEYCKVLQMGTKRPVSGMISGNTNLIIGAIAIGAILLLRKKKTKPKRKLKVISLPD